MDIPPQDVITRDNVPVRVNAVVYFRVMDPNRSVIEVENYVLGTSQISQKDLDDLLTNREAINEELQVIIDEHTEPWGVKVSAVEVKDVEIPQQMQRAMARQAESEREWRAKIIALRGASTRPPSASGRPQSGWRVLRVAAKALPDIGGDLQRAELYAHRPGPDGPFPPISAGLGRLWQPPRSAATTAVLSGAAQCRRRGAERLYEEGVGERPTGGEPF